MTKLLTQTGFDGCFIDILHSLQQQKKTVRPLSHITFALPPVKRWSASRSCRRFRDYPSPDVNFTNHLHAGFVYSQSMLVHFFGGGKEIDRKYVHKMLLKLTLDINITNLLAQYVNDPEYIIWHKMWCSHSCPTLLVDTTRSYKHLFCCALSSFFCTNCLRSVSLQIHLLTLAKISNSS